VANPEKAVDYISPAEALKEIAEAVPAGCHDNIVIIGSLAAGYHYFQNQQDMGVRTKDADCLLFPRENAREAGIAITETLLDANWRFRPDGRWSAPGNKTTPDTALPAVRLQPPSRSAWFIELLTVPETSSDRTLQWMRMETRNGDVYALPSFGFLSLAHWNPIRTDFGLLIARPEMMALANLLEHPTIKSDTMSGGFAGRPDIKRSNKDLGRVLAIARLAIGQDDDALLAWPDPWNAALRDRFPDDWRDLAASTGKGLRALLNSEQDLEQALYTCANGLLASRPPTLKQLQIVGERLLQDAIVPLEGEAAK
jgi:hypothetical protein